MPAGVIVPSGATSVILSPVITPRLVARSRPSTMPNSPGLKSASAPERISLPMSDTSGSSDGSTPRSATPLTAP